MRMDTSLCGMIAKIIIIFVGGIGFHIGGLKAMGYVLNHTTAPWLFLYQNLAGERFSWRLVAQALHESVPELPFDLSEIAWRMSRATGQGDSFTRDAPTVGSQ